MLSGMLFLLAVFLSAGLADAESDGGLFSSNKLCVKNAISSSAANAYEACSITTGMDLLGNRVSTVENSQTKLESTVEKTNDDLTKVDASVAALAARVTQLEGRGDAAPPTPALVAAVRLADQHAPGGDGGTHATSPFLFETESPKSAFAELSAAAAESWGGGASGVRFSAEPAGPLQFAVKIVSDETLSAAFTAASTYGFLLTLSCTFLPDVLTVYAGRTYYKVPVSGTMTSANVHQACEARDLVTPCYYATPGDSYNGGEAECTEVLPPTDASCSASHIDARLSCSLCGTTSASSCDALDGIFYHIANWKDGAAAALVGGSWKDGRNYSDRIGVCVEPENSG